MPRHLRVGLDARRARRGQRLLTAPRREGILAPEYRRPTAGLVGLTTLIAFEAVAVATAMPVTVRELHGLPAYAWAFTGFLVTFLYGTVASGEACDRTGPRTPMLRGLAFLVGGLMVAGCAPSMELLVAGRALQGLGAGFVLVAIYVVIARAYPERMRPRVFSAMAAAWVLPALIGPVVAGFFADRLTWRLVFLVVAVLVVPAAWAIWPTLRVVDGPPPSPSERVGRRRLALAAAVGAAALQQAGIVRGWLGALLLVAAVALLTPSVHRLLPAGALRLRRGLPTTVAMRGLLAGPFAVVDAFIPLMLVSQRGLTTTESGLALLGGTLGWAAGSWWQGRRASGTGHARMRLVRDGALLVCVGVAGVIAGVYVPAPGWVVGVAWTSAGAGMGLALASVNVVALELSPRSDQGATSAAIQVSDSLAAVFLTSVAGAIFATYHRGAGQDARVFVAIFGVALAVCVLAAAVAPRMLVRRAAVEAPGSPVARSAAG